MKSTTSKAKEEPLPLPYSLPIYTTTFIVDYAMKKTADGEMTMVFIIT